MSGCERACSRVCTCTRCSPSEANVAPCAIPQAMWPPLYPDCGPTSISISTHTRSDIYRGMSDTESWSCRRTGLRSASCYHSTLYAIASMSVYAGVCYPPAFLTHSGDKQRHVTPSSRPGVFDNQHLPTRRPLDPSVALYVLVCHNYNLASQSFFVFFR